MSPPSEKMAFQLQAPVNRFFERKLKGTRIYNLLIGVSDYAWFVTQTFRSVFLIKGKHLDAFLRVILLQIRFTGTHALPMLSIISLSLGATTIIQAVTFLPKLGQEDFLGNLLKLVIVREVGPLITAIVVLTRSGSAIAAELATQKLHREIDAIEMMGINPFLLMVLPRVIGGVIATSLLIVYFDFIAFIGGYMISMLVASFPFSSFLENLARSTTITDLTATSVKALISGMVIPLTCSYYGFKPETLFQIPIFVSKAVLRSLFGVFVVNAFVSVVFYL